MINTWNPITTAPKDGTTIIIRAVSGTNDKEVLFEGEASWRSEDKPALYDPISGECFAEACKITGWMRSDSPYRVPGIPVMWRVKNEQPKA